MQSKELRTKLELKPTVYKNKNFFLSKNVNRLNSSSEMRTKEDKSKSSKKQRPNVVRSPNSKQSKMPASKLS